MTRRTFHVARRSKLRAKLGHTHFVNLPHPEEQPGQPHGMNAVSHDQHLQMAEKAAPADAIACDGCAACVYQCPAGS